MAKTIRNPLIDLTVVSPCWRTDEGNIGVAVATRFCVNTAFMSGSDPTAKVAVRPIVPSLALVVCI